MNAPYPQQPGDQGYPQQPGYQPGYPSPGGQQPGYQQPGYPQPGYPQPGYQQPEYQQGGYPPPGYPGGGGSAIAVTTKFFPLSFFFLFVKPNITIDGQPTTGVWGRNVLPVAPGQHQLHVHTPYFLPSKVGSADLLVNVAPGQTLEVEYKCPLVVWSGGSLGPPPQKYNGMWFYWVLLAFVILLIVCCCGSALLNN